MMAVVWITFFWIYVSGVSVTAALIWCSIPDENYAILKSRMSGWKDYLALCQAVVIIMVFIIFGWWVLLPCAIYDTWKDRCQRRSR